uniref:Uncharacterized protein n=1 Tax=Romanomermis culicivorax TaxID=13658 RepID=A0A915IF63_ROMCU
MRTLPNTSSNCTSLGRQVKPKAPFSLWMEHQCKR